MWGAIAAVAGNILGDLIGSKIQGDENRRTAAAQHAYDMETLKYQNEYNLPSNQMQRIRDAGLNPNLMYGQGTMGNMESAPRYPNIMPADYQRAFSDLGTQFQQARLMDAQADLVNQKVEESGVKQDLMKAQSALIKNNPYMNSTYIESMVTQMKAVADMKQQEATWKTTMDTYMIQDPKGNEAMFEIRQRGMKAMDLSLQLLEQKYKLSEKDAQIKAEIVQSKEFQNDLAEIQRDWMKNGDITPQHIYMGIMMILQKLMSK